MRVQDIMSREVEAVAPSTEASAACERMKRKGIHHLVVLEDGRLVGVISDRDLGSSRARTFRDGKQVADLMTEHVIAVTPESTVRQAANRLRGHSIGCLPVLKEGKLKGILTVSDLLEVLGRGVERPIEHSTPWTLKDRGPRKRIRA